MSDKTLKGKRRPLSDFYGVISKESGERLEKETMEMRKIHRKLRRERIRRIAEELKK